MSNTSIMLFGSTARGDCNDNSDIDYLVVTDSELCEFSPNSAKASVSKYTWQELEDLAARQMLFIQHLKQEGRVVCDESGRLTECLGRFVPKRSYGDEHEAALSLLRLIKFIPNNKAPLLWYADVFYVVFRNIAITYLANSGKYVFSPHRLAELLIPNSIADFEYIQRAKYAYRRREYAHAIDEKRIYSAVTNILNEMSVVFNVKNCAHDDLVVYLYTLAVNEKEWYVRLRSAEGLLINRYDGNVPAVIWQKHKSIITNQSVYRDFISHCQADEAIEAIIMDAIEWH